MAVLVEQSLSSSGIATQLDLTGEFWSLQSIPICLITLYGIHTITDMLEEGPELLGSAQAKKM